MNLPPKDVGCHHTGFQKKCLALVSSSKCNRWRTLEGSNPQTGESFTGSDCIDNWLLTGMLDVSRKVAAGTTGIQAAQESFRNEVVRASERAAAIAISQQPSRRMIEN